MYIFRINYQVLEMPSLSMYNKLQTYQYQQEDYEIKCEKIQSKWKRFLCF